MCVYNKYLISERCHKIRFETPEMCVEPLLFFIRFKYVIIIIISIVRRRMSVITITIIICNLHFIMRHVHNIQRSDDHILSE